MEVRTLVAASEDGRRESVDLEVNDSAMPSLRITRASGAVTTHTGSDLFECLKEVRLMIEADNLLLCCQGARPTVFPSGMGRQMSNGRLAYPLRRNPSLTDADLIDIFSPAPLSEVGTVAEQRSAVLEFFRSSS
jgi:hypothetical protein